MSTYEDPHPKKKTTAATSDAPAEEFIEQENAPSKVEKPAADEPLTGEKKAPREE